MSGILLQLDSSNLPAAQALVSHDFTVNFDNTLNLSATRYELAFEKINFWYAWQNISAAFGNNTFTYTDGTGANIVTFPDGQYTITQIEDFVNAEITANGGIPAELNFVPNFSTLRVVIELSGGMVSVDLTTSTFNLLLGHVSAVIVATTSGANVANINNDVNTIFIHCDIVSGSFTNNESSDVLFQVVPTSGPGENIEVEALHLLYLPVERQRIQQIRMRLTDQLNRPLDLLGEPVTYLLHLRPAPDDEFDVKNR